MPGKIYPRCESAEFDEVTLTMVCRKRGWSECQGHHPDNGRACPDYHQCEC
jgi:hypothetical protein